MSIHEVGRRFRTDFADDPVKSSSIETDLRKLGDQLWRGEPLRLIDEVLLPPHSITPVSFMLPPDSLPPVSLATFLSSGRVHVRSRNAHLGLDVPEDSIKKLCQVIKKGELDQKDHVTLEMTNHGSRPVILGKDEKLLHFYVIPPAAEIKGDRLELFLGQEENRFIQMLGVEGEDWVRDFGESSQELQGLYLRINKDPRNTYWMPPSDGQLPIRLGELHSYREVREHLFQDDLVKISERPKPPGHIWIGQISEQKISPGIYAILSNEVYKREEDGMFKEISGEFQTECNLIEGRVNATSDGKDLSHHVEIVGDTAEWIRVTYARGKVVRG